MLGCCSNRGDSQHKNLAYARSMWKVTDVKWVEWVSKRSSETNEWNDEVNECKRSEHDTIVSGECSGDWRVSDRQAWMNGRVKWTEELRSKRSEWNEWNGRNYWTCELVMWGAVGAFCRRNADAFFKKYMKSINTKCPQDGFFVVSWDIWGHLVFIQAIWRDNMKRKKELWPLVGPFFIIKANMLFSMKREKELMWPLYGAFFFGCDCK